MAKRRMGLIALLFCLCLSLFPCQAFAASTEEATEAVATQKDCSLSVTCRYEDTLFAGVSVKLYRIANVSSDFNYSLTAPFAASGLELNGIRTQGEWNVVRSTLEAYIVANNISPNHTALTNEAGQASFSPLKTGMYFALFEDAVQDDISCSFISALIALPTLDNEGKCQYNISMSPKPSALPPIGPDGKTEYKVLKLWKGDEGKGTRPNSVEVEIFRNGDSFEKVILSDENNWSHSWLAEDDGASWLIIERNTPSGYTATIEQKETTFVLTNTLKTPPGHGDIIQTGDNANLMLYMVLLYASGSILLLIGIIGKRKRS